MAVHVFQKRINLFILGCSKEHGSLLVNFLNFEVTTKKNRRYSTRITPTDEIKPCPRVYSTSSKMITPTDKTKRSMNGQQYSTDSNIVTSIDEAKQCDQYYSTGRKRTTSSNIAKRSITDRDYSTSPRKVTTIEEAKRFMKDCFVAVGVPPDKAEIAANNLITADYRGHYSHGMNRLEMYIRDIKAGLTDIKSNLEILKETVATAWVDGKNGLGSIVGKRCMDIAIKKAKEAGVGFVAAKGCNHFGLAAIYTIQATNEGLIGLTFTNTSPLMVPTRAKQNAIGTNPLALGAPGLQGDNFLLDMATTAVAVGKIELARRKGEPIPEGWALNDDGIPETNAEIAAKAAKLMPLGGTERNSGHKGFGLGMLVEILSGILAGSKFGPYIRKWGDTSKEADLGQSFMAIDPNVFAPGFSIRLNDLMTYIRHMEPADPKKPVVVPGDYERIHMRKVEQDGGLLYAENQHKANKKLAKEFNVKPMSSKACS